MFSSLDKIDTLVKQPVASGPALCFQTDHRSADAIESTRDLSVLFAISRVLNPPRMLPGAHVIYGCQHKPPAFLREAIVSAGATVIVGDPTMALDAGLPRAPQCDISRVEALVQRAFAGLCRQVCDRERIGATQANLAVLDARARARLPAQDEIALWTLVLEEAAFAAEVIRGRWRIAPPLNPAMLPFVFARADASSSIIDLIGAVLKFDGRLSTLVYQN